MKLSFLGAAQTVTGSKYLAQTNHLSVLIDCGLYQGRKQLRQRNWQPQSFNPADLDAVILTHAHIDHSGYIPLLVKNGFKGKIYSSHGTYDLCRILLPDCGHLEEEDANRSNRYGYSKHKPALPLFTRLDAIDSLQYFAPTDFHEKITLTPDFSFSFLPAGHIIGSSLIRINHKGKITIFTGDLGRPHHPIMRPPESIINCDYLITEATYGDRLHEQTNPADELADIINNTVKKNGTIIIPAFAVGRSQDVLYYLHKLLIANRIPKIPVYLDSPMAQDASDLLIKYHQEHRLSKDECIAICKNAHYVKTPDESKALDEINQPRIIISASGMATGGRILHHLKTFLPDERNAVVFTGYQDAGTRGDRLVKGEPEIKIHGEMHPVRAKVYSLNNMSAHADYEEMIAWLRSIKNPPKRVFITHGELSSALSLKETIENTYQWQCTVPELMQDEILN